MKTYLIPLTETQAVEPLMPINDKSGGDPGKESHDAAPLRLNTRFA